MLGGDLKTYVTTQCPALYHKLQVPESRGVPPTPPAIHTTDYILTTLSLLTHIPHWIVKKAIFGKDREVVGSQIPMIVTTLINAS